MPTYEEYITGGGQLTAEEYSRLISKSWAYLNALTMGRVNTALPSRIAECVKYAAFAVLEEYQRQEHGGELASATNDGYSETYVTSKQTASQRLYSVAALHLAPTGLLYSGLGSCGGCWPC